MDRQPRKKLPGVKKLTSHQPNSNEEEKQATFTNEKSVKLGWKSGQIANLKPCEIPDCNCRLKKEIAILKKCRHPNVVRLREVIDAPASKKIYLGM